MRTDPPHDRLEPVARTLDGPLLRPRDQGKPAYAIRVPDHPAKRPTPLARLKRS